MIDAPSIFGLLLVFAYLFGAIPFSLIISRMKGVDLTKIGSGNFGATNVYRALGLKYALLVFALDIIKGVIPIYITISLFQSPIIHLFVGFSAIIGHTYSLFMGFRGGKGVATAIGVFTLMVPVPMGITLVVALIALFIFRYVSVSTLIGCVLLPVLMYYFDSPTPVIYAIGIISFFIVIKHRSNIRRLLNGTENKI